MRVSRRVPFKGVYKEYYKGYYEGSKRPYHSVLGFRRVVLQVHDWESIC